jgi:hypothetical protein
MKNCKYEVSDKGVLTITVNLKGETFGPSASGKTETIASSGGNIEIPGYPGVRVGVNAFGPLKAKKA